MLEQNIIRRVIILSQILGWLLELTSLLSNNSFKKIAQILRKIVSHT